MSGPKVVRVETRAEILEACRGWLARADVALAEWQRVAARNTVVDAEAAREVAARRARLDELLQADRFADLRAEAPRFEEWLAADLQMRLETKFAEEQRVRRARSNLRSTAASLLAALERNAVPLPVDLRAVLERGARGVGDSAAQAEGLDAAVARAFKLLADASSSRAAQASELTAELQELAARLGAGEVRQSLDEWLAVRDEAQRPEDPRFGLAERHLAQLAHYSGPEAAREFEVRLDALRGDEDAPLRGMRLDAVCLELAAAVQSARARDELRHATSASRAEAEAAGDAEQTAAVLAALERLIVAGDLDRARLALDALRVQQARRAAARAAVARREAVLRGLHALGYEVREGMVTAWAKEGRLAIRNPALPGFGVELSGDDASETLHMRAVSFQGSRQALMSGRDVELRWCSDLTELQRVLAAQGTQLAVEESTPAGAVPLRVVRADWIEDDEASALRTRTLGGG